MRRRAASLALVCAMLPAAAADAPFALLRTGFYFDGDLPANAAGDWLCLVRRKATSRLVPCTVELVPEELIEGYPGDRVRVREDLKVRFLLRGLTPASEPREVPAYVSKMRSLALGSLPIGDPAGSELRVVKEADGVRIALRSAEREQTVAKVEQIDDINGTTALHFAGDLDGDGRLDLLLDLSWHQAGNDYVLYLSSRAAPGELLGEAAKLSKSNC